MAPQNAQQALQSGQFANQAQAQQFAQRLASGEFGREAQMASFQTGQAAQDAVNRAISQNFGQAQAAGQELAGLKNLISNDIKSQLPGSLQVKVASYQYSEVVLRNRALFRGCNGQFLNQVQNNLGRQQYTVPLSVFIQVGAWTRTHRACLGKRCAHVGIGPVYPGRVGVCCRHCSSVCVCVCVCLLRSELHVEPGDGAAARGVPDARRGAPAPR